MIRGRRDHASTQPTTINGFLEDFSECYQSHDMELPNQDIDLSKESVGRTKVTDGMRKNIRLVTKVTFSHPLSLREN